jgi:tRNA(Glu) U13 pseudouridine synthase TruD
LLTRERSVCYVQAREFFVNKDMKAALNTMPHFMHIEVAVLKTLVKHGPTCYLNAIQAIQKNMQVR